MKKYVSDIIGKEYQMWSKEDNIFIDCQTGQGKTYFILEVFAKYLMESNKNILFLVNRKELSKEISRNKKTDNIDVMTYQRLEEQIEVHQQIKEYDCIVCDECHYFVTDAWNNKTDIIWRYLKKLEVIKIFMSATGDIAFKLFSEGKSYQYFVDRDYSYIEKLYFYEDNGYIDKILEDIPQDEKAIYFSNSVKKAHDMYLKFKNDSSFICSTGQERNYVKDITPNAIENESFSTKYLMATKVIDNGINLSDKKIKHIICDIVDLTTLIQCIGRRRIDGADETDKIKLYIKNYRTSELNRLRNTIKYDIKTADAYMFNREEDKLTRQDRMIPKLCHIDKSDNKIKTLILKYTLAKKQLQEIENMIEDGYHTLVLDKIKIDSIDIDYIDKMDNEKKIIDIEKYLSDMVGKKIFKEEKKVLVERISPTDERGRKQTSIAKLNEYLSKIGSKYILHSKRSNSQNYWIIK